MGPHTLRTNNMAFLGNLFPLHFRKGWALKIGPQITP